MRTILLGIAIMLMTAGTSSAQMITKVNGKCGLVDETSKVVLECKFEKVEPYQPGGHTKMAYVYNLNGNYGVLIISDFINTGLIYDSIYMKNGLLMLEAQGKLGFLSEDIQNISHIIEPAYTYLFPMARTMERYDNYVNEKTDKIAVKKDSLWGILNYADGTVQIPIKYKNEVVADSWSPLYESVDRKSELVTLIHPTTGVEFESTWLAEVALNHETRLLMSIDKFHYGENGSRQVKVWNYDSGQLLWTYTSHAARLEGYTLDGNIVYLKEEYQERFLLNKQADETVYSFHNCTNNALLLSHTSTNESTIRIARMEGKNGYEIYVSKTYNGVKKLVGSIYH